VHEVYFGLLSVINLKPEYYFRFTIRCGKKAGTLLKVQFPKQKQNSQKTRHSDLLDESEKTRSNEVQRQNVKSKCKTERELVYQGENKENEINIQYIGNRTTRHVEYLNVHY